MTTDAAPVAGAVGASVTQWPLTNENDDVHTPHVLVVHDCRERRRGAGRGSGELWDCRGR
jgi:hypothetical protein